MNGDSRIVKKIKGGVYTPPQFIQKEFTMPFIDNEPKAGSKTQIDDSLIYYMADNPQVAAQVLLTGMAAVLDGFYFQIGSNKAFTSFMFALKKEGFSIVFYADTDSVFVEEFAGTLDAIKRLHPRLAERVQRLFKALQIAAKWREDD